MPSFSNYRTCLMQTLRYTMSQLEYVKAKGIEVRFHGRGKNEASHYCGQCEVSIRSRVFEESYYYFYQMKILHQERIEIFQSFSVHLPKYSSWFFSLFFCSKGWSVQYPLHSWTRETSCRALHELRTQTVTEFARIRLSGGVSIERVDGHLRQFRIVKATSAARCNCTAECIVCHTTAKPTERNTGCILNKMASHLKQTHFGVGMHS